MTIHPKPTLLMFVSLCALTIGCSNLADVSSIDYVEGGNADTGMDDTSGEIDAEVDTSMSDTSTSDTGTSDTGTSDTGTSDTGTSDTGTSCQPTEEICDGQDNDCNGIVDDVIGGCDQECADNTSRPCGPETETGVCQFGTQQCIDGTWGSCEGAVNPSDDLCDGDDNDCDGEIDEDNAALLNSCMPLDGARRSGCMDGGCAYTCDSGREDLNMDLGDADSNGCECTISIEVCDNRDNDCDGDIDNNAIEDLCRARSGAEAVSCTEGQCSYRCNVDRYDLDGDLNAAPGINSNGCEYVCTARLQSELCDGLDNDCDGDIDNGDNISLESCPERANALPVSCAGGDIPCVYACREGFRDLNEDLRRSESNGCESDCSNIDCDRICTYDEAWIPIATITGNDIAVDDLRLSALPGGPMLVAWLAGGQLRYTVVDESGISRIILIDSSDVRYFDLSRNDQSWILGWTMTGQDTLFSRIITPDLEMVTTNRTWGSEDLSNLDEPAVALRNGSNLEDAAAWYAEANMGGEFTEGIQLGYTKTNGNRVNLNLNTETMGANIDLALSDTSASDSDWHGAAVWMEEGNLGAATAAWRTGSGLIRRYSLTPFSSVLKPAIIHLPGTGYAIATPFFEDGATEILIHTINFNGDELDEPFNVISSVSGFESHFAPTLLTANNVELSLAWQAADFNEEYYVIYRRAGYPIGVGRFEGFELSIGPEAIRDITISNTFLWLGRVRADEDLTEISILPLTFGGSPLCIDLGD